MRNVFDNTRKMVATCQQDAAFVAHQIGRRLTDNNVLKSIARSLSFNNGTYPTWMPHSFASGSAGLAFMCGVLDTCFPDAGWDRDGRQHINVAARSINSTEHVLPGVFQGLAGLGFAARCLSKDGSRYVRLLGEIDQTLVDFAQHAASALKDAHIGVPFSDYDAISGLAGVGGYLLARMQVSKTQPAVLAIINCFIERTLRWDGLAGWWTPPHLMVDHSIRNEAPDGCINCGLSHGVPGPLALLSLASIEGFAHPNLNEAISKLAEWLIANQVPDVAGPNWPSVVAQSMDGTRYLRIRSPRAAWCYGAPGVASALRLAGVALNNHDFCALAVEAFTAIFNRSRVQIPETAPGFCHGTTGLLHMAWHLAAQEDSADLKHDAKLLLKAFLARADESLPFFYRDSAIDGSLVDHPGLLDGAAGIAIVLASIGTGTPPIFERAYLLS